MLKRSLEDKMATCESLHAAAYPSCSCFKWLSSLLIKIPFVINMIQKIFAVDECRIVSEKNNYYNNGEVDGCLPKTMGNSLWGLANG